MRIVKKDYPFTIIIEDKISSKGNKYQSIGIGYTEKNPNATCENDKYNTTFINFFDEKDLLKLSSVSENAYRHLKDEREKEKQAQKNENI